MRTHEEDMAIVNAKRGRFGYKGKKQYAQLSETATKRFAELESMVSKCLENTRERLRSLGEALLEIKANPLHYYEKYKTFERYCQERWGISKQWAHMIASKTAVEKLLEAQPTETLTGVQRARLGVGEPLGVSIPAHAVSAMADPKISPENKVKAYTAAAEKCGGTPTAKAIKIELAKVKPVKKSQPKVEPKPEPKTDPRPADGINLDALQEPFRELRRQVDALSRGFDLLAKSDAGRYLRFQADKPDSGVVDTVHKAIKDIRRVIKAATPFCECGPCGGKGRSCKTCAGLGWVPEGVLA